MLNYVGYVDSNGSLNYLKPTADGALPLDLTTSSGSISINVGDVQIGAVELKDATTDTRQKVKSDGTDNAAVVMQNSQPLPTGAAISDYHRILMA